MSNFQGDVYPGAGFEESDNDLKRLVTVLWRGKGLILFITTLISVAAVVVALQIPDIYESKALLAPKEDDKTGGLGNIAQRYGGGLASLAGLSGLDLGGSKISKDLVAKEKIQSLDFYTRHLYESTLANLMAVSYWDPVSQEVIYDPDLYNAKDAVWVREVDYPLKIKPSAQEAHEHFLELLTLKEDAATGLLILKVKHESPIVAKDMIVAILNAVSEDLRSRDIKEAQESIEFLELQTTLTSLVSLDDIFSQLIEEQMKTIMLANVSKDYVFDVIDPPVVPERKVEPSRALICILASILGGMIGILIVLIRHYGLRIPIKS